MSPINRKAVEAIEELNRDIEPIGGRLGIPIDGLKQVNVANRPGFVYVRLRDNSNELVQAFNESVSAVYDLPVLVEFKNNRYVVIGRDTNRYSSWGSDSSYLPAHASQHSLLSNQLGGGDPVFVDGRQMMPGAVYPSGTLGGPNVLVSEFLFRNKIGSWLYIGNTGTPNISSLKPSGAAARMILVCLDYTSGGFVLLTGSTFSASLTGTSQIWPYLPNSNLDQVPLAAIRLVSGTTSIGWDNIYDARQWIDSGFPTGSASGGAGTPGGNNTNVQFNNAGAFGGTNSFVWNGSTGLYIGAPGTLPLEKGLIDLVSQGDGSSPKLQFWQFGPNAAPTIVGHKSNGTYLSPTTVLLNNELLRFWARGYDGSGWSGEQASFQFVADEIWSSAHRGTRAQLFITPTGTTSLDLSMEWLGTYTKSYKPMDLALNQIKSMGNPSEDQDAATKVYVDSLAGVNGWLSDSNTWSFSSADSPSFVLNVNANVTGTIGVGDKFSCSHLGQEKFFIVTKVGSLSSGTYPYTMYGGTDYTLTTGTISSVKYSYAKHPFGFPTNPDKWTVSLLDTTQAIDNSPATVTWINLGVDGGTSGLNIVLPIGSWKVSYSVVEQVVITLAAVTSIGMRFTLSTGSSVESDPQFSSIVSLPLPIGANTMNLSFFKEKHLLLNSRSTYFLNVFLSGGAVGATSVSLRGDALTTIVRAVCAYL